jgi:hypothetical protein
MSDPNCPNLRRVRDLEGAIKAAGFRVAPALLGDPTLWCVECGRDSGYHWGDCTKVKEAKGRRKMSKEKVKFESLDGEEMRFYGVENNVLCVARKGARKRIAFEAVEDESDGYRSMCEEVREVSVEGRIFFDAPIATVKVRESDGDVSGWKLVDVKDGHVWLVLGTDNVDDYYPLFRFDYTPKEKK